MRRPDFHLLVTVQAVPDAPYPLAVHSVLSTLMLDASGGEVRNVAWEMHDRRLLDAVGFVSPHRATFEIPVDHGMRPIDPTPSDVVWLLDGPRAGHGYSVAVSLHELRLVDEHGVEHTYRVHSVATERVALHSDAYSPIWRE
jgi:hypothetical protein